MTQSPGQIPEEYGGCRRSCFDLGEHTAVWGECEKAPLPPCEHPADSIGWDHGKFCVGCRDCGQEVTVQVLADQAQVSVVMGCRCIGGDCTGICGAGRSLGWTLDPAKIRAYVAAEQEGMRTSFSMMVSFRPDERDKLLMAARKAERTPENFVRMAVVRAVRKALSIED